MHVNWKRPAAIVTIFAMILLFHACAKVSKPTVSGGLIFLSGDSSAISITSNPVYIGTARARIESGRSDRPSAFHASPSDFVPGEIVVKYRPGFDPGAAQKALPSNRFVPSYSDRNIPRGAVSLLKVPENVKAQYTRDTLRDMTLSEIARLKTNPYVKYAEPNIIYRPLFTPNDPGYQNSGTLFQWHFPLILLDKLFDDAAGQVDLSGIRVAVIDTGIARPSGNDHPDFIEDFIEPPSSIFVSEFDFFSGDPDNIPYTDNYADDESTSVFHGTHVTGTIAAIANNSFGVVGVAGGNASITKKGVRIIPVRALDNSGGTLFEIAEAIYYAAGLWNVSFTTLSTPAKVINMSFGATFFSQILADAVAEAHEAGAVLVAAAGNEYSDGALYPAAYPEVISVGAVTVGAEKSPYSNYGDKIDLVAPGGNGIGETGSLKIDLDFNEELDWVLSTSSDSASPTLSYLPGTSMATPHVAGAAALVVKALTDAGNPNPSPETVKDILTSTAIPIGPSNYYGAGLLNVYKAVKTAQGQGEATEVIWAFPKTVRLTGNPPRGSFVLRNIGKPGDVQVKIESIPDHSTDLPDGFIDSIELEPASGTVDAVDGLAVTVTAKTGFSLSTSLHYAELKITDTTGSIDLGRVFVMYKYAGPVYVVAFDYDTGEPIAHVATSSAEGYRFTFPALEEGLYVIGASTDRDGDWYTFTAGEAFGFYKMHVYQDGTVSNAPIYLVNGDAITNADFPIIDWE